MEHQLELDYQSGVLEARCSCGKWKRGAAPQPGERLYQLYDRLEEEYRRHVQEVADPK